MARTGIVPSDDSRMASGPTSVPSEVSDAVVRSYLHAGASIVAALSKSLRSSASANACATARKLSSLTIAALAESSSNDRVHDSRAATAAKRLLGSNLPQDEQIK